MRSAQKELYGQAEPGKGVIPLIVSYRSDVGMQRSQNQDSVYVSEDPVGKLPNLFIVADGMGGHKAGDFASRYSIEKLKECISESVYDNRLLIVNDAIRRVNRMVYEKSVDYEEYKGMGTTLTLAYIDRYTLYTFQIGDSRLYVSNDSIRQVTKDHSYVEEMYRQGVISRESDEYRSKKHIITRAIGGNDFVVADIYEEQLEPGDIVLLCSDGLTNMVDDEAVHNILNTKASLDDKADSLIELANKNGGPDNISVVLVAIE